MKIRLLIALFCWMMIDTARANYIIDAYNRYERDICTNQLNWWYNTGPSQDDAIGDGMSYVLKSYLHMYSATSDMNYLNRFVQKSNEIMYGRNDMIPLPIGTLPTSDPIWSEFPYQNGLICWPMAEYIYLIKTAPQSIQHAPLPSSMQSPESSSYSTIPVNAQLNTHLDYALWLEAKLIETFEWYYYNICQTDDVYWDSNSGFINQYGTMAMDMQAAFGVTALFLGVTTGHQNPAIEDIWTVIEQRMFTAMNNDYFALWPIADPQVQFYFWGSGTWDSPEISCIHDVSHVARMSYFIRQCITFQTPNAYLFPIDRFKRTLNQKIVSAPKKFKTAIDGSNDWNLGGVCTQKLDNEMSQSLAILTPWLNYGTPGYGDQFYQSALDAFFGALKHINYSVSGMGFLSNTINNSGGVLLGLSALADNQGMLSPITVYRSGGDTPDNWSNIATGDLDGNAATKDHIVATRESDGQIFVWKLNGNNDLQGVANLATGGSDDWRGITVGEFNGNVNDGKEIAAVREVDGGFFIWKLNAQNQFIQLYANFTSGTGNDWVDMTSGNFDGNVSNGDEIAAIRNVDGAVFVWRTGGLGMTSYIYSTIAGPNNDWRGLTSVDSEGDGIPEIACIRENTSALFVWKALNGQLTTHAYHSFTSNNAWRGLSAGDFDGNGVEELVCNRNYDGTMFFWKIQNGGIAALGSEQFPDDWNNGVLCAGNVANRLGACKRESVLYFRGYDGDFFIQDAQLQNEVPSDCLFSEVKMQILDNTIEVGESTLLFSATTLDISIVSNPIETQCKFLISADFTGTGELFITDLAGRDILINSVTIIPGKQELTIDLESLPSGMYIARLNTARGSSQSVRILKR